jgi:hypothetical protein
MAEEILLKETLTEEMKGLGASLTRTLDEARWPVVASFWYFEEDFNRWKLILASPRVNTDGKKEAYGAVISALKALQQSRANLNHITVVAPDHPLVRDFGVSHPDRLDDRRHSVSPTGDQRTHLRRRLRVPRHIRIRRGVIDPSRYCVITSSTLRFCCLPAAVLFVTIGDSSPLPLALMWSSGMPAETR